jgi:hypothetical protein
MQKLAQQRLLIAAAAPSPSPWKGPLVTYERIFLSCLDQERIFLSCLDPCMRATPALSTSFAD